MTGREEPVVFDCGGDRLVGILHHAAPDCRVGVAVVNVVGGPQYRTGSHRQFVLTARTLSAGGIATFRFDYRGMGDSDGHPRTFDDIDEDISAALRLVRERLPDCRIVLMGLCDAASAILMHAGRHPGDADGLVLMNPWVRTEATAARARTEHYYRGRLASRDFWGRLARLQINPFRAGWGYLADQLRGRLGRSDRTGFIVRMAQGLCVARAPILIVLSSEDLTSREFQSLIESDAEWRALVSTANVTMLPASGADHTFSEPADLDRISLETLSWIRRYLADPADPDGHRGALRTS